MPHTERIVLSRVRLRSDVLRASTLQSRFDALMVLEGVRYCASVDRRKRVLNFQEAGVDRLLADYAKEHGYRINLKMRLRDAIDVEDLPLSAKERNFAFTPT